ncbi:Fic family protein [Gammaproteobacteria bacterium]|nr:Fic family protein [Gammaproteobacteria bacterium]
MKVLNPKDINITKSLDRMLSLIDDEYAELRELGKFSKEEKKKAHENVLNQAKNNDLRVSLDMEGIRTSEGQTIEETAAFTMDMERKKIDFDPDDTSFHIRNMLRASAYINQEEIKNGLLTRRMIKELHSIICDGDPKLQIKHIGAFRSDTRKIKGRNLKLPDPIELDNLMDDLCLEFETSDAKKFNHVVVQACWLQHQFARIHPFHDGNGRTARMLSNWVLNKNDYLPVHLGEITRKRYLDLLVAADDGDFTPFIEYVAQQALDMITRFKGSIISTRESKNIISRGIEGGLNALLNRELGRKQIEYHTWRSQYANIVDAFKTASEQANASSESDPKARNLVRFKFYDLPMITKEVYETLLKLGVAGESGAFNLIFQTSNKYDEWEDTYKCVAYYAKHFPRWVSYEDEGKDGAAQSVFENSVGLYFGGYPLPANVPYPRTRRQVGKRDGSKHQVPWANERINLREILFLEGIRIGGKKYFVYEKSNDQYAEEENVVDETYEREDISAEEIPQIAAKFILNVFHAYIR